LLFPDCLRGRGLEQACLRGAFALSISGAQPQLFDNVRAIANQTVTQAESAVLRAIARRFAILDAAARIH
jgi:hypothetical protein